MEELGINVDVTEDADTFAGNAKKKGVGDNEALRRNYSCGRQRSCVDALGGAPGVYSARYSGEGATDLKTTSFFLKIWRGKRTEKRISHAPWCAAFPTGKP